MEKNKKIILGIIGALFILGLFGFLKSKSGNYKHYVKQQYKIEAKGIGEKIDEMLLGKWVKLIEDEEIEEDGYNLLVERSQILTIPETEFLSREILKDGDDITVLYVDGDKKIVERVAITYYDAPKLSILIDDVGMSLDAINEFSEIESPLTFASIPFLPKSREGASKLKDLGFEVILHMPMAGSSDSLNMRTDGILLASMSKAEIYDAFDKALEDVGEVDGFNNHMGSRFTANEAKMKELLTYAKKKDLFFIDSNTAVKNMGYPVAKEIGVPTYYCNHFLDNSRVIEDMEKEIEVAVRLAKRNEKALVIGHFHSGMAEAIKNKLEYIEEQGVKLVFSSELLEQ